MNPVLKHRKTKIVSGWLTRDSNGGVVLWEEFQDRHELQLEKGQWNNMFWARLITTERTWTDKEFKKLYTGIPRKGRAIYVQIEIVVD